MFNSNRNSVCAEIGYNRMGVAWFHNANHSHGTSARYGRTLLTKIVATKYNF